MFFFSIDFSHVFNFIGHLFIDLNEFVKAAIDPPPPLPNGYQYFAEYSTAELSCLAPDGLPSPLVWWEGPSGQILSPPSHTFNSVLTLTRVLNEDAGVYKCRAGNSVRNVSIQTNLIVTCKFLNQQLYLNAFVFVFLRT